MFQRFQAMKEERDGGFTLIELLVVILIIAILAAIAIPVFLRQREKGWKSQMESAVKNAATAEESYLTANPDYTEDVTALEDDEGLKYAEDVGLAIEAEGGTAYCITAAHSNLGADRVYYHSEIGEPQDTAPSGVTPACPAGAPPAAP